VTHQAKTPQDALSADRRLPAPRVRIGDRIDPKGLVRRWERYQIVRALIRDTVRTVRTLRKHGYCARDAQNPAMLHSHHKNKIREALWVIENAYAAEVAGIHAHEPLLVGSVANQCYAPGVQGAHGGLSYSCQVLFRAEKDGNHVATITPPLSSVFTDRRLAERIIEEDRPNPE
jgi:hypothetical protein